MDPVDYINWGFVGCSEFKNINYYSLSEENFYSMHTTFAATRDAFASAVYNYVLDTRAMYYAHDEYDGEDIPTSCIDEIGKQKFVEAVDNIYIKQFNFYKKASIFFNSITPQSSQYKLTGVANYSFYKLDTSPGFNQRWYDFISIDYTIDYTDKQTLTRQIYEEYVNSYADYVYAVKVFIKISTNSDLEEFIPPL